MRTMPAFEHSFTPRALAFDPGRLRGLSERMLRSHWEHNYCGAIKALATVNQHLAHASLDQDSPPYIYNTLKREHLLRTGSIVFHEHYFDNLGGNGIAGAAERKIISDAFGSFDRWENEFRRIGAGLGGGSGWVVLGYNTHTHRLENYWLADHGHAPAATLPILVMDMYEHAYQIDYGAAAAKYIDAFFNNIQWETVAARLDSVDRHRPGFGAVPETHQSASATIETTAASITVDELADWRAHGTPHILIDVRRDRRRLQDGAEIAGATWLNPASWLDWKDSIARDKTVVIYCASGEEIGQGLALALRVLGVPARYLAGGYDAWLSQGHPVQKL